MSRWRAQLTSPLRTSRHAASRHWRGAASASSPARFAVDRALLRGLQQCEPLASLVPVDALKQEPAPGRAMQARAREEHARRKQNRDQARAASASRIARDARTRARRTPARRKGGTSCKGGTGRCNSACRSIWSTSAHGRLPVTCRVTLLRSTPGSGASATLPEALSGAVGVEGCAGAVRARRRPVLKRPAWLCFGVGRAPHASNEVLRQPGR